jgi:undecaprenyl-diphosphatase
VTAALVLLFLGGWDSDLYHGVADGWRSDELTVVMRAATEFGNMPALAGIGVAAFFCGGRDLRRTARLSGVAWGGAMAVLTGVRAVVDRPRPNDPEPGWLNSAFPSGHTTGYFAVASTYAFKYTQAAPLLGLGGAMVAFSRVYLREHWPSDVLAGAALGTAAGYAATRLQGPLDRLLDRIPGVRVGLFRPVDDGVELVSFRL